MQFLPSSDRVDTAVWMHYMDTKQLEKKLDGNYTRMLEQHPTSCIVTYYPSQKLSKLDEPNMPKTAGEVRTSS